MSTHSTGEMPTSRNGATPSAKVLLDTENGSLAFTASNRPNAAKLMSSLRRLGYDNYAAIKDLCDNCTDAHASTVAVLVAADKSSNYPYKITIADNGIGMDWETLDQALRLGSETERNEVSDLGKFGMGLVTASLSICRRVEIITRQESGPTLYSVQDVDEIIACNDFVKHISEAGPEQIKIFDEVLEGTEHGTVVLLSKCDQLQNKNQKPFTDKLKKELGQTFRRFLQSDQLKIWVNDQKIEAVDPLMRGEEGCVEYSHGIYDFELVDEDGITRKEQIEVRLVMLPDFGIEGNTHRKINIPNQGFYLLRNFREIASGETFDLFAKHNKFNRFRGEILVSGSLDDFLGVDFTKQKPKFTQAFHDRLFQELKNQIKTIGSQLEKRKVSVEDEKSAAHHSEAARQIGQKAHLLDKPLLDVEKRDVAGGKAKQQKTDSTVAKERINISKTQKKEIVLPCRFETASMNSLGPIWEAEPRGRTLVIRWNIDHPFYQRFILENQDNPSLITATDFLVYSLAAAELKFTPDDDEETQENRQQMMEDIRAAISRNMRNLLS